MLEMWDSFVGFIFLDVAGFWNGMSVALEGELKRMMNGVDSARYSGQQDFFHPPLQPLQRRPIPLPAKVLLQRIHKHSILHSSLRKQGHRRVKLQVIRIPKHLVR